MNKLVIDPKLRALMDPDFAYDSDENLKAEQVEVVQDHDLLHDFDINRRYNNSGASSPLNDAHGHVSAVSVTLDSHSIQEDIRAAAESKEQIRVLVQPDADERYLYENEKFHYTSQFQARTHADRFDFYQGPKEHFRGAVDKSLDEKRDQEYGGDDFGRHVTEEEHDRSNNLDSNQVHSHGARNMHTYGHASESGNLNQHSNDKWFLENQYNDEQDRQGEGRKEEKYENGGDEENCGSDEYETTSDISEEYETQLQDLFLKINKFKQDFHQLIKKLDEASLESAKARYHYLNDISARENMFMSTTTNMLLDTVAKLLPRKRLPNGNHSNEWASDTNLKTIMNDESKASESTKNGSSSRNADSLNTLYNATLESDPCSKLPNFGVILIKSPTNVEQLWNEYTKLPSDSNMIALLKLMLQQQSKDTIKKSDIVLMKQRKTTIQELEKKYGSSWRNNDKNFSRQINRRKKIWGCIEQGLKDGLSLKTCFHILDKYVEERGKGLSWYYNGVPFKLADVAPSYVTDGQF